MQVTHWKPLDPLLTIVIAGNILRSGGRLVWGAAGRVCSITPIPYHGVRFRTTGYRHLIEVHLLFAYLMPLGEATPLGYDSGGAGCRAS